MAILLKIQGTSRKESLSYENFPHSCYDQYFTCSTDILYPKYPFHRQYSPNLTSMTSYFLSAFPHLIKISSYLLFIFLIIIPMKNLTILLVIFVLINISQQQTHQIDLDLPLTVRYSSLAKTKRESISQFISYLKNKVNKYKLAFGFAHSAQVLMPWWVRDRVGKDFYDECVSIARGADLPISDIIVFNYMYELGAATDFCTAITISSPTMKLLGRNLDYGYQEYLANNSVHLQYVSKGQIIFQTLGHAGFVGTHTVLRRSSSRLPYQFAITLNERVQGGLHLTLEQMIRTKCETSPYALMKAVREAQGDVNTVIKRLSQFDTCAAVYWTGISRQGRSFVIEKNRGKGINFLQSPSKQSGIEFIVQTNHDAKVMDPDGRSTAANQKVHNFISSRDSISSPSIWSILTESPNFNKLTLMTGLINVITGEIEHKIWNKST